MLNKLTRSIFVKNLSIYLGGSVISKFLSSITFILIGYALPPEKYAEFTLFIICTEFLSVFVGFGLSSGMLRIIWNDKIEILSNCIFTTFFFGAILLFFILFLGSDFILFLPSSYHFLNSFILLIPIKVISISAILIINSFYVSIEKPSKFVNINLANSIFNMLFLILMINTANTNDDILKKIIYVQTFSSFISMIYALSVSFKYINYSSVSYNRIISILKQTWVFFLKNLLGAFQSYSSRIILSVIATNYLLGVYSFYTTLINQLSFIFIVFDKAYIPKIRNLLLKNNNEKKIKALALVKKASKLYLNLFVIAIIISPIFFYLIYTMRDKITILQPAYIENIMLFGFMFYVWLVGNFRSFYDVWQYIKEKIDLYIIISQLFASLQLLIGSIYFYNYFGINGLVFNQLIIYAVYNLFTIFCYKKFVVNKNIKI